MLKDLYFLLEALEDSLIDFPYQHSHDNIVPETGPQTPVSNPLYKSLANSILY